VVIVLVHIILLSDQCNYGFNTSGFDAQKKMPRLGRCLHAFNWKVIKNMVKNFSQCCLYRRRASDEIKLILKLKVVSSIRYQPMTKYFM